MTHTHTCIHMHAHTYAHACAQAHIHTHIHTHTHTHTHTQRLTDIHMPEAWDPIYIPKAMFNFNVGSLASFVDGTGDFKKLGGLGHAPGKFYI